MKIQDAIDKVNAVRGLRVRPTKKGLYSVEVAYGPAGERVKWKVINLISGKDLVRWVRE